MATPIDARGFREKVNRKQLTVISLSLFLLCGCGLVNDEETHFALCENCGKAFRVESRKSIFEITDKKNTDTIICPICNHTQNLASAVNRHMIYSVFSEERNKAYRRFIKKQQEADEALEEVRSDDDILSNLSESH